MIAKLPWSWRQFMTAMRKAGYVNDGQGVFIHKETGFKYYGWTYSKDWQEAWKEWANAHQTPAPF